jgi:Fic family protein
VTSQGSLVAFVRDSNAIEGIHRDPTAKEVVVHETFLALHEVTIADRESFVNDVAGASLRRHPGMNVRVGSQEPLPGGPKIEVYLGELFPTIRAGDTTPWEAHVEYETLHPFMDGNGRSGRVLWAWQMAREGQDPFAIPVLRRLYYQALEASR